MTNKEEIVSPLPDIQRGTCEMKAKVFFVLFLLFASRTKANQPLIVAHRGASDYAPENTIPAFKLAWEMGADAIEGDFHLTKDQNIVCIHDANTKRVAPLSKSVGYSTLEELRTLDVGSWFDEKCKGTNIPTLSEVIATIPPKKKIYIEIKCGPEILDNLLQQLADSKLEQEQIVVISFDEEVIRELKKRDSSIKAYWLLSFKKDDLTGGLEPSLEEVLEILNKVMANGLSTSYKHVDQSIIREIEKAGFEYHVWTVDQLETARKFKKWGARSITTNLPNYMKNYLDKPMPPPVLKPGEPAFLPYSRMAERERLIDAKLRHGPQYSSRLELFINSDYKKGGIVFLGDSLIEDFPLDEFFKHKNVINCGIRDDGIQGVAERLDICIESAEPRKIYLMAGIKDLLREPPEAFEKLSRRFEKLIRGIKRNGPEAGITVFSLLPPAGSHSGKKHLVDRFNDLLREVAKKEGLIYLDLHPYFADEKGELHSTLTMEGMDLNSDGYLIWLRAILSEEEFLEAIINYAEHWLEEYGGSFPVAGIDPPSTGTYPGNRGPDELIIYTPNYEKPTTHTNQWGTEAVVRNGMVVKQNDHNTPIPSDGYVVSGHGEASRWIEEYLKSGILTEYDQTAIRIKDPPESEMNPRQRLKYLKKCLFGLFRTGDKSETNKNALTLLQRILRIHTQGKAHEGRELDKISREIKEIQNRDRKRK